MEPVPRQPNRRSFEAADETEEKPFFLSRKERPVRTPKAYKICDWISEGLIYFMVVFSPWAFGATQDWAVWTLNIAAYLLGAVLLAKWILRVSTGYRPARWGDDEEEAGGKRPILFSRILTWSLAALTILFLAYGAVSAVNARASFQPRQRIFDYKDDYAHWLPHSYDAASTWEALAMYFGWACFFWAARDWLLGKSPSERRRVSGRDAEEDEETFSEGERAGRLPGAGEHFAAVEQDQRSPFHGRAGKADGERWKFWTLCLPLQCRDLFQHGVAALLRFLADAAQ